MISPRAARCSSRVRSSRLLLESLEPRQLLSADAAIHAAANHELSGTIAALGNNFQVIEGRMAAPVAGDSLAVRVDWGDGSASDATVVVNADGGFELKGDHTFAAAGSYAIGITAYGGDGSYLITTAMGSITANITGDAPAPQAAADGSFTGTITSVTPLGAAQPAGFTIPAGGAGAGISTVSIDWGDGSSSLASLVANDLGGFDIVGTHQYTAAGTYTVQVTGSAGVAPSADGAADWSLINPLYLSQSLTVSSVAAPII